LRSRKRSPDRLYQSNGGGGAIERAAGPGRLLLDIAEQTTCILLAADARRIAASAAFMISRTGTIGDSLAERLLGAARFPRHMGPDLIGMRPRDVERRRRKLPQTMRRLDRLVSRLVSFSTLNQPVGRDGSCGSIRGPADEALRSARSAPVMASTAK